jgi:hypothetical protein
MARIAGGDTIKVQASNNIYTVLLALANVAVVMGLAVLFIRAAALGVQLLKF